MSCPDPVYKDMISACSEIWNYTPFNMPVIIPVSIDTVCIYNECWLCSELTTVQMNGSLSIVKKSACHSLLPILQPHFLLPTQLSSEDYPAGAVSCHSGCAAKPRGSPGEHCGPASLYTVQHQLAQGQDPSILVCHLI